MKTAPEEENFSTLRAADPFTGSNLPPQNHLGPPTPSPPIIQSSVTITCFLYLIFFPILCNTYEAGNLSPSFVMFFFRKNIQPMHKTGNW